MQPLGETRPEQEHHAVVLVRASGAAHALLQSLDLPGRQQASARQLGSVGPLDPVQSLRKAVDDQHVASVAGKVDTVVTVDEHVEPGVGVRAHPLHPGGQVVLVKDHRGVVLPVPCTGAARHDDGDVPRLGKAEDDLAGLVLVSGGMRLLRDQDQAVTDVAGVGGHDRLCDLDRFSAEVGDEDAVVGEGRGQVDAPPGLPEPGKDIGVDARGRDLEGPRREDRAAIRQDVDQERPGEDVRRFAAERVQRFQDRPLAVNPGPVGNYLDRAGAIVGQIQVGGGRLLFKRIFKYVEEFVVDGIAPRDGEPECVLSLAQAGMCVIDDDGSRGLDRGVGWRCRPHRISTGR